MYPPPHTQPYVPVPPPPPLRRRWQHPALIVVLLVIFPPAGIALTWTTSWRREQKVVVTALSGLWFLLPFLVPSEEKPKGDAKAERPVAVTTASPSPTPTPTPTPTPSPTPSKTEVPAMPSLVGGPYAGAEQLLAAHRGRTYAAYKDVTLPADRAAWLVCFQRPDAGAPVSSMVPVVYLTEPGVPCPASPNATLHEPTPTPPPKPRPTPQEPTVAPEPVRTRAPEPEPEPTRDEDASSGGGGNVSYANCAAVRAAGAAPIRRGDPGYSSRLDRDGDGVACEN
ncbi:excalibur calcium-binding domain-containing protein [Streptomyces sp. NPDC001744]|uniref:excalibur calcium-binding domain-containing protein n=1 Tax=Streptomyces sp. NPDC001744 TaxID=3364606 RepID=UPI0036825AA2